ncbi:MAG TPA: adenylate/guanylate cyclase domain-containing protein [Candidatus Limnocylindria bacterium]
MPEERKLATLLFADIVGSAALGGAEDPELVRRTFARVFAEMRQLLTLHGGTVEKFVGDAVMAVFGVPVVHDDDADRAVRAAFALRERVASLAPSLPFAVSLRIGINSGQVVAGSEGADTLVTGPPVNAAARLQQHASPDEIVVGALTRSLTASTVRYGEARRVEAKNMGELELFPALALESALPDQRRGLGQLRAPLIGRDAELRLLRESQLKTSEERSGNLVTVYGQAGVGKSRLVAELVEIIGRERVLRGRCLPYGAGITYWPVQEMLRADLNITTDDSHDNATRKLRGGVLAAFGGANEDADAVARRVAVIAGLERAEDALPGTSGADLGQELRWGVRRYFEQRATEYPLTLIFDDIHWAEDPMLETIEHLAEWSRAPLFILCLARPDLRDRRPSWGGGLMNAAAVRLEPLSVEDTRRLIAALLDIDELPESLRDRIAERAQGNPLFVEELLRMLIGAGHIERRDGRWIATKSIGDVAVPASLQGLLTARLDQLPPEVKRALQRASVVGKVFYPDALAALGHVEGSVDDLLVAAARRDFVIERNERGPGGGRAWQFKHILIRDVAYDSVPKEERSHLHDAVGRWLESVAQLRRDEYAEIVAYHADQAYALATELRDAGAQALGNRALALVLGAARRARRAGEQQAALTLYARAAAIAEAIGAELAVRVEATAFAALMRADLEGVGAAGRDLEQALALARRTGPSEALVSLLEFQVRELNAGPTVAEEGVAAARAVADHDLVVYALLVAAWPPWYVGDMAGCAGALREARAYAIEHDARRHWRFLLNREGHVARQSGDFMSFVTVTNELLAAAASSESKIERAIGPAQVRWNMADVAADYEAALEAANAWLRVVPELGLPGVGALSRGAEALAGLGRSEEAIQHFREALRRDELRGTPAAFTGERRQALARAQLAAGRIDEARESAERAYHEIDDDDAFSRSTTAVALAVVRDAQGEIEEADRLFRLAIDAAKGYQWLGVLARVDYSRFLIGQRRAAEARAQLEIARDFYTHPFVARRRKIVDELLRRCDEVRAT